MNGVVSELNTLGVLRRSSIFSCGVSAAVGAVFVAESRLLFVSEILFGFLELNLLFL